MYIKEFSGMNPLNSGHMVLVLYIHKILTFGNSNPLKKKKLDAKVLGWLLVMSMTIYMIY